MSVVAFNVQRTDDGPCDAHVYTLKTDSEDESDGVGEGIRRYKNMLATLGYTSDHHEDITVGGVLQRARRDRHDLDEYERDELRTDGSRRR